MANPNIVAVTSIYGKTTYLTPSATTSVVLLPNAASSGKIIKINQIVASNVEGTSIAVTSGTASKISYSISYESISAA